MADNNDDILDSSDDFEKLLNDFINTKIDDEDEAENDDSSLEEAFAQEESEIKLTPEGEKQNREASEAFAQEMAAAFDDARTAIAEDENQPQLGSEESELAQAFLNYKSSVGKLARENLHEDFECGFQIDDLYPNYKPSVGRLLSDDLVTGWTLLCRIFPQDVATFPVTSTDEQFLSFAEGLKNQDLQLAVISYVEILIDMESCELTYQIKLAKYQEKHIKRIMYEEYLARKERQRLFTEAVKAKNFPIDAERLISNYFRVAQKDADGAFQALTTNPAIFAPIDFSKIKPRFFGLVKVSPKDGIRVNLEIGDFLKKLKV